ncbi:MAG: transposase [Bacillota bacterium]
MRRLAQPGSDLGVELGYRCRWGGPGGMKTSTGLPLPRLSFKGSSGPVLNERGWLTFNERSGSVFYTDPIEDQTNGMVEWERSKQGGKEPWPKRQWTAEEKMQIVLAGLMPEANIAAICREHQISRSQFYRWRDAFLKGGRAALQNGPSSREQELERKLCEVGRGCHRDSAKTGSPSPSWEPKQMFGKDKRSYEN